MPIGKKLSAAKREAIVQLRREEALGALAIAKRLHIAKSTAQRYVAEAEQGHTLTGVEAALSDLSTRVVVLVAALTQHGGLQGLTQSWGPQRRTAVLQKVAAIEARWGVVAAQARQATGEA